MALMFPRLARNFVKNGYFPTDSETLRRLKGMLMFSTPKNNATAHIRLLDPCCGEGAALLELAEHADYQWPGVRKNIETFGIEFDRERAWHAKQHLSRVAHADVEDVVVKARSMGLLFLNPPYGFGLKDDEGQLDANRGEGARRLEREFLKKTVPYLALGGVLVYIVPYYALDKQIRTYLARHFADLRFYMAPEQQFQQCVILGRKVRSGHPSKDVLDMLARAQAGEFEDRVLPEPEHAIEKYTVPRVADEAAMDFYAIRLDGMQLADELVRWSNATLWQGFDRLFGQIKANRRRPLRQMSQWHLALALAAGQVTGRIESTSGRVFLIKGDTYKKKERRVETTVDADGNVSETIVMTDRFVPAINAIEFTSDHRLGNIVKIG